MSMRDASRHYTICEILREINDLHQENTEHDILIRNKLCVAEKMAKKMSSKLKEYNQNIFKDWWERNKDYNDDLERRLKETYCTGNENNNSNV